LIEVLHRANVLSECTETRANDFGGITTIFRLAPLWPERGTG
jgi:hypothetical protein